MITLSVDSYWLRDFTASHDTEKTSNMWRSVHSCVCMHLIGFKVLVAKLDEIFLWAVVADLLGAGLLLYRGSAFSGIQKPPSQRKGKNQHSRGEKTGERCEYMCVCVCCVEKRIQSSENAALLHPVFSVPHTHTSVHTTTLGSGLCWARFGPGPCLQAASVPRFPALSHWPSTQPQPPSTGRQAKWLEPISGAKSPDCRCLCCLAGVIVTGGM